MPVCSHSRASTSAIVQTFPRSSSAFPRGFLKRLGDRGQQVFQHGARAEVDLGRHLHAGGEAVFLPVGFEELALEVGMPDFLQPSSPLLQLQRFPRPVKHR